MDAKDDKGVGEHDRCAPDHRQSRVLKTGLTREGGRLMRPPCFVCLFYYFFFAAFFATFLAAFFVAILPVLPVIKRVRCDAFIAANEGIVFRQNSVKKNR